MKAMLARTISAPAQAAGHEFRNRRRPSFSCQRTVSGCKVLRSASGMVSEDGLKWKVLDFGVSGAAKTAVEEAQVAFPGGGVGEGRKSGGGRDGGGAGGTSGGGSEKNAMGAYYRKMIEANPADPLLLRNYGKFLHEVEGDVGKAEEYYGRALLASPGDGEVLSLYGNLIWEAEKDQDRAQVYFDQAVQASPDDCFVLGSYAHFLWNAEEDEEDEEDESVRVMEIKDSSIMTAI